MGSGLVLSIFPGLDVLAMGFEREGWTVVHGPDVLFGRDIREFHPPAGAFEGLIGGDPCQSHSALANLVRAKGLEPTFPDMSGEFERVVNEAQPRWFLRENVERAPDVAPHGYGVATFLLDNAWLDAGDGLGQEQSRRRRFWFGVRGLSEPPDLRRWLRAAALELPAAAQSVTSRAASVPVAIGGSGRVKRTAVTGAHTCHARPKNSHGERYTMPQMLSLQGLEPELLQHAPFTMAAKRKLVGNAVALPTAQALAVAVREAGAEVSKLRLAEALRTWRPDAPCSDCGARVLEFHRSGCPRLPAVLDR